MSLRKDLKFSYTGTVLHKACEAKREHHAGRLGYWEDELAKAKDVFKSAGVEIREYAVTGGTRLQGVIDPSAQQRMDECQGKVTEHKDKTAEYDRWSRGFKANGDATFELDPDDIAYFGL